MPNTNNRVTIRTPRHIAPKIGGMVQGTLDGNLAMERNLEYLALGNKKVQAMLETASGRARGHHYPTRRRAASYASTTAP